METPEVGVISQVTGIGAFPWQSIEGIHWNEVCVGSIRSLAHVPETIRPYLRVVGDPSLYLTPSGEWKSGMIIAVRRELLLDYIEQCMITCGKCSIDLLTSPSIVQAIERPAEFCKLGIDKEEGENNDNR